MSRHLYQCSYCGETWPTLRRVMTCCDPAAHDPADAMDEPDIVVGD